MAHIVPDMTRETSTTTGTGTYNLAGLVTGFADFNERMATNDTVWARVSMGADYEIGLYTFTDATPDTLARTTIFESSNADAAVNWGAGVKDIIACIPAKFFNEYVARADAAQTLTDAQRLQAISNLAPGGLNCGRLTYVSTTAIKFAPFNGDLIKINGSVYRIPSAGIAGVANTSVFVNGVGASNLANSTLYYVYAFINSGVVTADFSTTARATSTTAGNIGTEIKNGDETRTLIGLIRTNSSGQFADSATQRFVLSWFNRLPVSAQTVNGAGAGTTSTTFVEINNAVRVEFIAWGDCACLMMGSTTVAVNSGTWGGYADLNLDGTDVGASAKGADGTAGMWNQLTVFHNAIPAVGYHYLGMNGKSQGGGFTATYTETSLAVQIF